MKLSKNGSILFLLATAMSSFAVEKLVIFDPALHQETVMAIVTETQDSFFPGINSVPAAQRSMVEQASIKQFESNLTTVGYITFLLCVDEDPVGFVQYFFYKESCESVIRGLESQGISLEQLIELNPAFMDQLRAQFPDKDVDALPLGKIEGIAVAKKYQRQGYGKKLFQHAVEQLINDEKQVASINLIVDVDNEAARRLYESEGFVIDESKSVPMLPVVFYQKSVR